MSASDQLPDAPPVLRLLGSPDAAACEGDVCAVPPAVQPGPRPQEDAGR